MSGPRPHRPAAFEVGGACPHCSETLQPSDRAVTCPRCGISQHESCWAHHRGCGSYHCLREERFEPAGAAADVVVTPEDLEAVPEDRLRPVAAARRPAGAPVPAPPAPAARTSALAGWSFGLGVAGVILAGIPGLVAAVLGGVALARIGSSRGRLAGTGLAVAGIALGMMSAIGWMVGFALHLDAETDPFAEDFPRDIRLEGTPEPIGSALRQTVVVEGVAASGGFFSGRNKWIGSGVVLGVSGGRARIATNRHVALGSAGGKAASEERPNLRVRFIGGEIETATVRWLAPGTVDLALLECAVPAGQQALAKLDVARVLRVGDPVFAVGSPRGLAWTYTRGVVSGFATKRDPGSRPVEVIQTQTPISPGSSGGGLFSEDGGLVGINTWTASGPGTEGLHFSIGVRTLAELLAEAGERPE